MLSHEKIASSQQDPESEFFSADGPLAFGRIRAPRLDWLSRAEHEEVIDPDLPIIDAHHHLWDRPGNTYLLNEFLDDVGSGHNIEATVAVEGGAMYRTHGPEEFRHFGEVEFLDGVAAMSASGEYGPTQVAAAIIARGDLALGSGIDPMLEAMTTLSSRVRGVRSFAGWDADQSLGTPVDTRPGMLREEAAIAVARSLARRDLSMEVTVFFTQLDDVAHLARKVPEMSLILGHVGLPLGYAAYAGRQDEVFTTWKRGMSELAALPNVTVKLGGLMMRYAAFDYASAPRPVTSDELAALWRSYLVDSIELFGAERCAFESNFPVEKIGVTYRALWNAFKKIAGDASDVERRALFSETARRVYRLDGTGRP